MLTTNYRILCDTPNTTYTIYKLTPYDCVCFYRSELNERETKKIHRVQNKPRKHCLRLLLFGLVCRFHSLIYSLHSFASIVHIQFGRGGFFFSLFILGYLLCVFCMNHFKRSPNIQRRRKIERPRRPKHNPVLCDCRRRLVTVVVVVAVCVFAAAAIVLLYLSSIVSYIFVSLTFRSILYSLEVVVFLLVLLELVRSHTQTQIFFLVLCLF